MTLASCRQNFNELLADSDNRVIALSGKWGTGKSHLFRRVRDDAKKVADEQRAAKEVKGKAPEEIQKLEVSADIGDAIYVSIFGLNSITELKKRIAQGVLPGLGNGGPAVEAVGKLVGGVKTALKAFHSGFSALDELELIALPAFIKGRFVVIDDIERKHDSLTIDEILGFIDDCVQTLGCRVLLILNSDQLAKPELWERFREKVIDQELRLDTSPAEAFDIAADLTHCPYADRIKPSVEACGITNIRIIRKILRVANRLLSGRGEVPEHVLSRVLPSMTLLSAIHYKGMEDGPTMDFVLQFESMVVAMLLLDKNSRERETPEGRAQLRWRLLMDQLGIRSTDAFEALVADYLKTGLFDGSAVGQAIERFADEGQQLAMRARAHTFFEHCWWYPNLSDQDLIEEVRSMIPEVRLLDVYTVTSLHDRAAALRDGAAVANELVEAWLAWARSRREAAGEWAIDEDFNRHHRPLHPRIADEFQASLERQHLRVTVLDVCRKVSTDHGWGDREKRCMRAITPEGYEATIRSATGADFRVLLLQSMDFLKSRGAYAESFGNGPQAFLAACQTIVRQEPDGRLAQIVRATFQSEGMGDLLDGDRAAVAEDPSNDTANHEPHAA